MSRYEQQDLQAKLAGVEPLATLKGAGGVIDRTLAALGVDKAPAPQPQQPQPSVEAFLTPATPGS
jgi:hypothetical protein